MIRPSTFTNSLSETAPSEANVPLLCWDLAHPLLAKRQQIAKDLETFAQLKARFDWQFETDLRPLLANDLTVIITDRAARIQWVSAGFYNLTGYQSGEVLGKSPALFQGPRTSSRTKALIRQKLACAEAVAVKMLNYRQEGTPYWCQITIQPLVNSHNQCTHFIAFEKESPDASR